MRIAAISDVHGNLAALDAVLADAAARSVDLVVNLGDLLSGALQPGETADRASDTVRAAPVEALGGRCVFITPPVAIYERARTLAAEVGGHYLDQYAVAERALDWRGDDLAGELLAQIAQQCGQDPRWVVVGTGTGATSASLGRYIRCHGLDSGLAVVDSENSAYFPGWASGAGDYATGMPSRIEGIGRPRMEAGFIPSLIDAVVPVPDAASMAAARAVRATTGLAVGASTGTNLWGALHLIARMRARGARGCVATLGCDPADRHLRTHHDDTWAITKDLNPAPYTAVIEDFLAAGRDPPHLHR